MLNGVWIDIACKYAAAFSQEIHKIASEAAAGVEDAHAGRDAAAEELIEEVDVDLAELGLERHNNDCASSQISRSRSPAGMALAIAADWPAQTCMRW